jgi:DNA-binding transcriptional ArsR family regulator
MSAKERTLESIGLAGSGQSNDGSEGKKESDTTEETTDSLPLDQVFEILKNRRRRKVLRYLQDREEVSLGEIAEHVAADENDTTVKQVTSKERKCAYVGLYQCHLPKMDDLGVVEFNQNRGRVSLGRNVDQLTEYLDWEETSTRPWPLYYATVSAAGVGLGGLAGLVIGSGATLAVSLAALFGVCLLSLTQVRSERVNATRAE